MEKVCSGYGFLKYGEIIEVLCYSKKSNNYKIDSNFITSKDFDKADPSEILVFWTSELDRLREFLFYGNPRAGSELFDILKRLDNYEPCPLIVYREGDSSGNYKYSITVGYEENAL